MKTKQSILVIVICTIIFSLGSLSCNSVKTAVACPDITVKKSNYKAHRKARNSQPLFAQKTRSKSQNVRRVKENQIQEINSDAPIAVNDRTINISKAEFTKGFIASIDNTVYPEIQSAPAFSLPVGNKELNIEQNSNIVQVVMCDTIYLKSGMKIIGKVEEIGQTEIKYRRCNNLSGPVISLLKSEISRIHYPNGAIELFAPKETTFQIQTNSPVVNPAPAKTEGLGLAGFITGLVGLFIASIPLGTIAIVFGGISLSKINKNPQRHSGKGFAIASIVLGLVDVVVMIVLLAAMM